MPEDRSLASAGQTTRILEVDGCKFPQDRYYDIDYDVWLEPVAEDVVVVGLTSILQAMAGRFSSIRPKPISTELNPGKSFCTVESRKYVGALRSPISGRIVEVNQKVVENPTIGNVDPYDEGWVAKILTKDSLENNSALLRGDQASDALRRKVEERRLLCFKFVPDVMVNAVGLLCPGPVVRLSEEMNSEEIGSVIHLVADDPASEGDVRSWSRIRGQELLENRRQGSLYHFLVRKVK